MRISLKFPFTYLLSISSINKKASYLISFHHLDRFSFMILFRFIESDENGGEMRDGIFFLNDTFLRDWNCKLYTFVDSIPFERNSIPFLIFSKCRGILDYLTIVFWMVVEFENADLVKASWKLANFLRVFCGKFIA